MSCTIVSTPAVGAASWTSWITQQGLTDRGFMRVSLTNFSGTVASAIGTGSVVECAGSIYTATETAISLATGTASASVAVYIMAIPAAAGTTCTFELNSVAPTWVDSKQGFYASAASVTRAIGGMYIGTAATYYSKFIYTPEMLTGYLLPSGKTRPILTRIFEIGEWNMVATTTKNIPVGISDYKKIRSISIMIRNDADSRNEDFNSFEVGTAEILNKYVYADATEIRMYRDTNGRFDNADFDGTASTVVNRGWVNIEYEA